MSSYAVELGNLVTRDGRLICVITEPGLADRVVEGLEMLDEIDEWVEQVTEQQGQ